MYHLSVLGRADTEKLLHMDQVLPVVESVYKQKSDAKAEIYPMVYAEFNPGVCDMDIKSGWLQQDGNYGFKLTSWYSQNPTKGLPEIVAVVMVFDDKTGVPIGLLDAGHVGGMRTGAAGAIGAKYLARKDAKNLLVVGAGNIATYQIAATLQACPNLTHVTIFDPMSAEQAQNKATQMPSILAERFGYATDVTFSATDDVKTALETADVVITVTPSKTPLIQAEWVKPGTHFSCIGADMPGKEELDPAIMQRARVFADDIGQCVSVGELELPIKQGVIAQSDILGEIGDVITGRVMGRTSDADITVFDSTGLALMDIAVAKLAFETAKQANIGQTVTL